MFVTKAELLLATLPTPAMSRIASLTDQIVALRDAWAWRLKEGNALDDVTPQARP